MKIDYGILVEFLCLVVVFGSVILFCASVVGGILGWY